MSDIVLKHTKASLRMGSVIHGQPFGSSSYHQSDRDITDKNNIQCLESAEINLIESCLSIFPARILVKGIVSESVISALIQKDHQIVFSDDEMGQKTEKQSFDLLLIQNALEKEDPLVIFSKAFELLRHDGNVLITRKCLQHYFSDDSKSDSLSNALALADRAGFEPVYETNPLLSDLINSNSGKSHDHRLLQLRKKSSSKWRVGILERRHIPEMLDLFERIFGQPMTASLWQWKYSQKMSRAIGVWREDRLIAHYGGMPRDILLAGQPEKAVQIGDVMVDPSERGTLAKKGPMFLMAAAFQEDYIGYGKRFLTAYGFPNKRAMQVAQHLKVYARVGKMMEISWQPASKRPLFQTRLELISNESDFEQLAEQIDALWHNMASDLRAATVGVRNATYLHYRYLSHPHQDYQILLVKNRFDGQIRGLVVLRHDVFETEIMDVVAPLSELPLLIEHARRVSGIQGKERLFLCITENFISNFAVSGSNVSDPQIPIPTPIWSHAPAVETLYDRWWLTGGDMDFR